MTNIQHLMKTTREFAHDFNWTNPIAVTLTMKQAIFKDGCLTQATPYDHSQNLHHFLNVLNKRLFGGLARKRWLLSVLSVLEQGAFGRSHYHLAIDRPPHITVEQYTRHIQTEWRKTTWGDDQVHVSLEGGERWLNYMTKSRTKAAYLDSIDWINTHNPSAPVSAITLPYKLQRRIVPNKLIFAKAAKVARECQCFFS